MPDEKFVPLHGGGMETIVEKKRPQRMCVVCRRMRDKSELIRAVRDKEGAFKVDPTGKSPGRGAYVCLDGDCISRLEKVRGLERAFKSAVPGEIKEEILKRGESELNG